MMGNFPIRLLITIHGAEKFQARLCTQTIITIMVKFELSLITRTVCHFKLLKCVGIVHTSQHDTIQLSAKMIKIRST